MMKLKFFVNKILGWFSQLKHKLYLVLRRTTRIQTSIILKEMEEIIMNVMSEKEAKELQQKFIKCKTIDEQKKLLKEFGIDFTFGDPITKKEIITEKGEENNDNKGTSTENK